MVLTDLVLVAALLAVAISYVRKAGRELQRRAIVWGVVLATVTFATPLILNHVLVSDFLHRFHKLLAFVGAFVVFIACIAAARHTARFRLSGVQGFRPSRRR